MSDRIFNEPWMDNINPKLLFKYWKEKDTNKILLTKEHGVELSHIKDGFGIISVVSCPPFDKNLINNTQPD